MLHILTNSCRFLYVNLFLFLVIAGTRNPPQLPPQPLYNNFVRPTGQAGPVMPESTVVNAGSASGSVIPPAAPVLTAPQPTLPVSSNTVANFETQKEEVVLNVPYFLNSLCIVTSH